MDPLRQYGSHAFIPYLADSATPSPASSTSTFASSFDSLHKQAPSERDLPPLDLLNTSTWTYCGPLLHPTSSALPPSFHTWSSSTISGPLLPRLLPFLSFLHKFLRAAGAEHYWLTIRATKPTTEYDTVRWHTDDVFFDYDGEKDRVGFDQQQRRSKGHKRKKGGNPGYWKLATTLLGPGTLFLKDGQRARRIQRVAKRKECEKRGEHTCSQFRCLGCLDAVEAVRQTLAQDFAHEEITIPQFGEVAFFRLGDEEGAVHSEPPCHEDRIFVNVVPGTEKELQALMGRWGLGFPRAWCFGVPVAFDDISFPTVIRRVDSPMEYCESEDDWDSSSESLSTMSMNLKEEYSKWLEEKGFQFSQVFGQTGQSRKRRCDRKAKGDARIGSMGYWV